MRGRAILLATLACAGCGGTPDQTPTPSVLVTSAAPVPGSATRWIAAYGTATPAANGTETLSIAQPGQVTRLFTTQGASVRAGQPLAAFAVAPSARAGFAAATTAAEAARRELDATRRLLGEQLATRDQLVQAEKASADAAAALEAQRREGAGQTVQTIVAPFDGIVTALPVAGGDRTQAGAPIVTVARDRALVATVGVAPGERGALTVGAAARVMRLAGGPPIAGRVLRIDGQLNPATHLVDVDLSFPAGAFLPGEPVRAQLAAGTASGWIVPHAALAWEGDRAEVFEIVGGKARSVPVAVAQPDGDRDVVTGDLSAGRRIVVAGAYQATDGDAVREARR